MRRGKGVRTALIAIIGFMPTKGEGAIGSLDYTPEERRALAKKAERLLPGPALFPAHPDLGVPGQRRRPPAPASRREAPPPAPAPPHPEAIRLTLGGAGPRTQAGSAVLILVLTLAAAGRLQSSRRVYLADGITSWDFTSL
ncbi:hypothetical protein CRUP_022841 [Coryphaenoides rupestris]|nr:hypothetical protein CRUP_022841 [Coryphaenoides rupestris]